jgi:hypothetical protein
MPGSIVQASPGGISPRTINNIHVSNHNHIEIMRTAREEGDKQESQDAVWVQGSLEEDKQR